MKSLSDMFIFWLEVVVVLLIKSQLTFSVVIWKQLVPYYSGIQFSILKVTVGPVLERVGVVLAERHCSTEPWHMK